MPSKKRKVTYSENTDPVDGDRRNVEVSEEQSVDDNNTTTTESLTEQDDERYSPSSGR